MKFIFAELRSRLGSNLKGVLPKWHGPFQARLTHSVIPSEVEESLILTITSGKRCLGCARHDKKPIWATRPLDLAPTNFTDFPNHALLIRDRDARSVLLHNGELLPLSRHQ